MDFFKIQGLTKYFGGLPAVNGLDIHVQEKEILALIGPNGAGKSTVFNLITSFLKPTSGHILFQDEDITGLPTHRIASKGIVRTFQQTTLFKEMSVLRNILVAHELLGRCGSWGRFWGVGRSRSDEADFLKSSLEIITYLHLEQYRDELAKNLSHGHQRALEIGIALAVRPKLLLLDEPFTGMNPEETQTAMEMVLGLREQRGITIILVEHDMKAVMGLSDRIVVISFGKKIAEGRPEEIQKNPEVIDAYLGKEEEV